MNKRSKQLEAVLIMYGVFSLFMGIVGLCYRSQYKGVSRSPFTVAYQDPNNAMLFSSIALMVIGVFLVGMSIRLSSRKKKELLKAIARDETERNRVLSLASNQVEISAEEFLSLRKPQEFTGIYILHNEDKDMYYVGQSVRVMQRVRQHLTGHGNGDVYADFKYGDHFTVRTISMADSGYLSIDELERDMIDAYDAKGSGYNRTGGNTV